MTISEKTIKILSKISKILGIIISILYLIVLFCSQITLVFILFSLVKYLLLFVPEANKIFETILYLGVGGIWCLIGDLLIKPKLDKAIDYLFK